MCARSIYPLPIIPSFMGTFADIFVWWVSSRKHFSSLSVVGFPPHAFSWMHEVWLPCFKSCSCCLLLYYQAAHMLGWCLLKSVCNVPREERTSLHHIAKVTCEPCILLSSATQQARHPPSVYASGVPEVLGKCSGSCFKNARSNT